MATKEYFEQCGIDVSRLDKSELIEKIKDFKGKFKLDFTDDYLNTASIDRYLRFFKLDVL